MAHAGGRPSKLTPEVIKLAQDYVSASDNMGVHQLLPTIERLALTLDVHRDTLQEWEKVNVQFSVILGRLRAIQADKLLQNSLLGRYNPVISKLMLSKHGYIEKREEDITSGGERLEGNINASQLDQLIRARAKRTDT